MQVRAKPETVRESAPPPPREDQSAFLQNILESSTEYSIIGNDLTGTILLWNAGARRLYGYEPEEVIGKANSSMLHTPEDIAAGKPAQVMAAALQAGKWEGTITRVRKSGERFTARVVITPRRDTTGKSIGFLLISKDISDEIRLTEASLDPVVTISAEGKITDVLYNASVYKDTWGNVLGVFAATRDVTAQKEAETEVAEQRNNELERLAELERFQRLNVGRELKMIELKSK